MLRSYLGTRGSAAALSVALMVVSAPADATAQTQVKPGFNLFSVEQDVEVGRQAAAQAERQMPVLRDQRAASYVNDIVRRMAQNAPGAQFPYQAKVVNAADINAFALPGGFMYFNRGLIDAARTEGEFAGVVAHEMAHIALRHGTHQVSKQHAAQAGLGVLGALIGGRGANADLVRVAGGLGMSALFLKFTRDMETQADILGAQMMAGAGYDPMEMVSFFELLQQKGGNRGGFFSDHPTPANRAQRVRQEAQAIGAPTRRTDGSGLRELQGDLRGQPVDRRDTRNVYDQRQDQERFPRTQRRSARGVSFDPPSSRMRRFEDRGGLFTIEYPDNWRVLESNGTGVTIVPEGAVIDDGNGGSSILAGAIVDEYSLDGSYDDRGDDDRDRRYEDRDRRDRDDDRRYEDRDRRRDGGRIDLQAATDDVVERIRSGNPHLRLRGQPRRATIDGGAGTSVQMQGRSPATNQQEDVTVYTRQLADGRVVYAVFVSPRQGGTDLSRTFDRMIGSLRIEERRK